MVLKRLIMLECLIHNVRLYARYIDTKSNAAADALSCLQTARFRNLTKNWGMDFECTDIPQDTWPLTKIWKPS